ncbi:Protein kinase-like (PK-like) [Glarea lozoyensis ATCC 20868]|uniref:Protein kinase-like (PK-like) n=1 Tax=Glarea lozoyensis (strain ATCC 20868 / MF5171) TaxID=1116229 RepID=S3CHF4_GLAL2|nr:Protein kinase-like (PK-like) [Glarea lozoyensis ATCC 20868]EPE24724.1 Protein kinase-like (PK-like) [Glarea lozoyensis ATCC 20868]
MLFIRRYCTDSARTASSTFISNSGLKYIRSKVLKADPKNHSKSLFLAHRDGLPFVLKTVSPSVFEQSNGLKHEFKSKRFRHHIDESENECVLVYEWYKDDLLQLIRKQPDIPLRSRKWILREIAETLMDYHAKNWIHIDVKPDNVFVDWNTDSQGHIKPERVALGNLDLSLKLEGDHLLNIPNGGMIGNCLFVITTVEKLQVNFRELDEEGTSHRDALMQILLVYFGPLPKGLLTHIKDEVWVQKIKESAAALEEMGIGDDVRLANWTQESQPDLDVDTKRFLSRMLNLDPARRARMEQILVDSWWSS